MDVSEMEKEVLLTVYRCAKKIAEYSWDDIDADAKADMDLLIKATEEVEQFMKLKTSAENSLRAKMYQNVAR